MIEILCLECCSNGIHVQNVITKCGLSENVLFDFFATESFRGGQGGYMRLTIKKGYFKYNSCSLFNNNTYKYNLQQSTSGKLL